MIDHQKVASYFKETGKYTIKNPIIKLRKRIVRDVIGQINNKLVLDVGCGDGSLTIEYISNNQISFLDITNEMLDIVKSKISSDNQVNAEYINSDILNLQTEKNFDIIVCIGVFAHISNIDELVNKLKCLIKENGKIILQFTDARNLITRLYLFKTKYLSKNRYSYQLNIHTKNQIKKIIKKNDLQIFQSKSYWPVFPFFSPFGFKAQVYLLSIFYQNRFLSKFGSEKVYVIGI